ncbi:MAG: hypothetical protein IJF43_04600 [Firmicutes bacterium]|nr:hypothetical protein [Bacillota bacterium]
MTEEYRIFTAYCRTLLRTLEQIECHLENIEPAAILVMGYPHKDAIPLDLHFKYRPIDEIVFYDSF